MNECARLADAGAPAGTVVVAKRQKAARGRRGRTWYCAEDGLSLSIVLRPTRSVTEVPALTLAAGLATCEAVNHYGAGASLKWPNDVVVGTRKMAGILAEMKTRRGGVDSVIVGIGINVTTIPQPIDDIATSLARCSASVPSRDELLETLLERLHHWLEIFDDRGLAAIATPWRRLARFGQRYIGESDSGTAVDLAADGGLVVERDDGSRFVALAGELTLGGAR